MVNNKRDLECCRTLLLSLEDDDLAQRLTKSRWNPGHEGKRWDEEAGWVANDDVKTVLDDNWLQEACLAFSVPTVRGRNRQAEVIEAVMQAVRAERALRSGPAALRDAERRSSHLERLRDRAAVQHEAKNLGVCSKGSLGPLKEKVLHRACPEQLRVEVVAEIIVARRRLPAADEECERHALAYVEGALARRYVSASAGEQLSPEQVRRWETVFAALPPEARPTWSQDPVLVRAQCYFEAHGHLDIPKAKKGDSPDDAQLASDLRHDRAAKLRDAKDREGLLVRRQLTDVSDATSSPLFQYCRMHVWGTCPRVPAGKMLCKDFTAPPSARAEPVSSTDVVSSNAIIKKCTPHFPVSRLLFNCVRASQIRLVRQVDMQGACL